MTYSSREETAKILDAAWRWVQSVDYRVTARWVFYRLLQSGIYDTKTGYKHLLGILSKARKEFYELWRPWTLADDTRAPILTEHGGWYTLYCRGWGFKSEEEWVKTVRKELNCPLDRWKSQPAYVEIWFEAAAMQGQFLHYADENIPLLAFHGDVSIPAKWTTAQRLADRYMDLRVPIQIYYFGDYDPKGLIIPNSAWEDIHTWTMAIIRNKDKNLAREALFQFERVGINSDQIEKLNIPENPERPGTYQWEGLDDKQAEQLIERTENELDFESFEAVKQTEREIIERFRSNLK